MEIILIIGIASVGDEHVDKLAKIAAACNTEEAVDKILAMDVNDVYDLFK